MHEPDWFCQCSITFKRDARFSCSNSGYCLSLPSTMSRPWRRARLRCGITYICLILGPFLGTSLFCGNCRSNILTTLFCHRTSLQAAKFDRVLILWIVLHESPMICPWTWVSSMEILSHVFKSTKSRYFICWQFFKVCEEVIGAKSLQVTLGQTLLGLISSHMN